MGETFRERLHLPYYDYIPQRGLKNLALYKYSGLDLSLIAKWILQPFWSWLANYLPEWPAYVLPHFYLFHTCTLHDRLRNIAIHTHHNEKSVN